MKEDWAYISGFFDGEGCLCFYVNKPKIRYPEVIFSNNDRVVLEWIQKKIGGGNIHSQKQRGLSTGITYNLSIRKMALVEEVIIQMLPYLKIKRNKALELLTYLQKREKK